MNIFRRSKETPGSDLTVTVSSKGKGRKIIDVGNSGLFFEVGKRSTHSQFWPQDEVIHDSRNAPLFGFSLLAGLFGLRSYLNSPQSEADGVSWNNFRDVKSINHPQMNSFLKKLLGSGVKTNRTEITPQGVVWMHTTIDMSRIADLPPNDPLARKMEIAAKALRK